MFGWGGVGLLAWDCWSGVSVGWGVGASWGVLGREARTGLLIARGFRRVVVCFRGGRRSAGNRWISVDASVWQMEQVIGGFKGMDGLCDGREGAGGGSECLVRRGR